MCVTSVTQSKYAARTTKVLACRGHDVPCATYLFTTFRDRFLNVTVRVMRFRLSEETSTARVPLHEVIIPSIICPSFGSTFFDGPKVLPERVAFFYELGVVRAFVRVPRDAAAIPIPVAHHPFFLRY